jgi:hypothetical protein
LDNILVRLHNIGRCVITPRMMSAFLPCSF